MGNIANKKPSGIIQGAFFIFSMYIKEVKRKITKTILIQVNFEQTGSYQLPIFIIIPQI